MMTLTIRERPWDPESTIELGLERLPDYGEGRWSLTYGGRFIGQVSKYTGSLDRTIGRLRWPGKRRTLWAAHPPVGRTNWGHISRAEAVRWLLRG
jgi:hypothetical protein